MASTPVIVDLTAGGTTNAGGVVPANPLVGNVRSQPILGVVFHHSGGDGLVGAMTAGQAPGLQHGTGAQYYIDTDGTIYRYAPDVDVISNIRNPANQYRTDKGLPTSVLSNANVIGIEVIASDSDHFTEAQRESAAALGSYLAQTYSIPADLIVGHGQIQGGEGGNKMPTEGVNLASMTRDEVNGLLPPMNIPTVATELDVKPKSSVMALQDIRDNGLDHISSLMSARFGVLGDAADQVTSTLGSEGATKAAGSGFADSTIRQVMSHNDYEAARQAAGAGGIGSVSDMRLAALLGPQTATAEGVGHLPAWDQFDAEFGAPEVAPGGMGSLVFVRSPLLETGAAEDFYRSVQIQPADEVVTIPSSQIERGVPRVLTQGGTVQDTKTSRLRTDQSNSVDTLGALVASVYEGMGLRREIGTSQIERTPQVIGTSQIERGPSRLTPAQEDALFADMSGRSTPTSQIEGSRPVIGTSQIERSPPIIGTSQIERGPARAVIPVERPAIRTFEAIKDADLSPPPYVPPKPSPVASPKAPLSEMFKGTEYETMGNSFSVYFGTSTQPASDPIAREIGNVAKAAADLLTPAPVPKPQPTSTATVKAIPQSQIERSAPRVTPANSSGSPDDRSSVAPTYPAVDNRPRATALTPLVMNPTAPGFAGSTDENKDQSRLVPTQVATTVANPAYDVWKTQMDAYTAAASNKSYVPYSGYGDPNGAALTQPSAVPPPPGPAPAKTITVTKTQNVRQVIPVEKPKATFIGTATKRVYTEGEQFSTKDGVVTAQADGTFKNNETGVVHKGVGAAQAAIAKQDAQRAAFNAATAKSIG